MNLVDVAFGIMVLLIEVLCNYLAFLITFLILLCSIFFTYYYFQIVRVSQNVYFCIPNQSFVNNLTVLRFHFQLPMVACASSEFAQFLKQSMPILSEKYWPTFWCYESRIQSALAYILCPGFNVRYDR